MRDAVESLMRSGPLVIAPRYLGYLLRALRGQVAAEPMPAPVFQGRPLRGAMIQDGIAVIPVVGPIMQRPDPWAAFGAVGIGDLRATMQVALAEPSIDGILLVVDSPGGEVAGVADLADELYAARGRKPMAAVADEGMFSAAYWLGSAVGPITVPRTGAVGSIGALAVHADMSAALEQMGIRMTVVRSGEKKAQFSPFQPLTAAARADLQAEVDRIAGLFIDAVAQQRGLAAKEIRAMEAGTFQGEAAVAAGLADHVGSLDEAFGAFRAQLDGGSSRGRMTAMADEKPGLPAPPEPDAALEASARQVAKAEILSLQQAHDEAKKRAETAAREQERKRAAEIHRWCAFAQKPDLAETYIASDLSLEQVRNELLSQTASAPFEIHGEHGPLTRRPTLSIDEIYARRREMIARSQRERIHY